MRRILMLGCVTLIAAGWVGPDTRAADEPKAPTAKEWNEAIDRAIAYYKSSQSEDGTWGKDSNPGVTGVVVMTLLRTGKVTAKDPMIEKALKAIEGMADPKSGSLAGKDGKGRLQNYLTSVNLTALQESDPKQYAALSEKAIKFLKTMPYDKDQGKDPKDAYYGGVGYDGSTRPDMSNTTFFLEALRVAQVPADDPVYKKVLVYVSRSQDLKSEFNDQPWAGKVNDGSFNYGAGPAGQKKGADADAARPGYGSITASGLVALADCGVKKGDVRYDKALEWIQKEFTTEANPGTGGERGYYLYLRMTAEALTRAGVDSVTDKEKKVHDWRTEISSAVLRRQQKDGSWVNKVPAWMEGNPDLATAWAISALIRCKPAAK